MSVLFHFTRILLKLEHDLITADLLNQTLTKKVILLCKKLFQLGVANEYLSRVLNTIITDKIVDKNHLSQEAIFHFLFQ